jgi:hypothetical protein
MKPLNFDNSPCSPISSNCVIWAGPDLACIKLCKGDTITDVVAKLATELCTLLDTFNISAYDISCFNLTNASPQTFTDLINFLIVKICELENLPSPTTPTNPSSPNCPTDCIVNVAPCFVIGSATSLPLTDYAIAIGQKVCNLASDIALQQSAIDDLDLRVTTLENAPAPSYTTPSIVMAETLPSVPSLAAGSSQYINVVLDSFINQIWFPFVDATGSTGLLSTAISNETVAATDLSLVNPAAQMSAQYAGLWTTPTDTIAGTINNIWACIKDLRDQTPVSVVPLDTATINMTVTGGPAYVISADVIPSAPNVADSATIGFVVSAGPSFTLTANAIVPHAVSASGAPTNLSNITPSLITSLADGTIQLAPALYNEDGGYNPATGIWTCPADGRYNLNFFLRIRNTSTGFSSGSVIAGLANPSATTVYVSSTCGITNILRYVEISGTALGVDLTAGTQVCLIAVNFSDISYTSNPSDTARITIQKIK